jgi:hypothetical protein
VASRTVRAQERTATSWREEFKRKVRIGCRAFNCYRLLAPRLHRAGPEVVYKFYSHKVLRWLSLILAVTGGVSVLAGLVLANEWLVAMTLAGLGTGTLALGALGVKPLSRIWEIFLAHVAVTIGVVEALRGERYQVWAPTRSGWATVPPQRLGPAAGAMIHARRS